MALASRFATTTWYSVSRRRTLSLPAMGLGFPLQQKWIIRRRPLLTRHSQSASANNSHRQEFARSAISPTKSFLVAPVLGPGDHSASSRFQFPRAKGKQSAGACTIMLLRALKFLSKFGRAANATVIKITTFLVFCWWPGSWVFFDLFVNTQLRSNDRKGLQSAAIQHSHLSLEVQEIKAAYARVKKSNKSAEALFQATGSQVRDWRHSYDVLDDVKFLLAHVNSDAAQKCDQRRILKNISKWASWSYNVEGVLTAATKLASLNQEDVSISQLRWFQNFTSAICNLSLVAYHATADDQ